MSKLLNAQRLLTSWFFTRMARAPLVLFSVLSGALCSKGLFSFAAFECAAFVFCALTFLRFTDDAISIENDKWRHPERVLPRAPLGEVLGAGLLLLCACLTLFCLRSLSAGVAFLGLTLLMAAFYTSRAIFADDQESLLWRHLLLLKYPLIVFVMSPSIHMAWLLALFSAAGIYEVLHDERAQKLEGAFRALGLNALVLVVALLWGFQSA